mgnify:FL=1
MFSKWKIRGLEGFVFDKEGSLYKLPFKRELRSYKLRLLKKQDKNRYKINGEWWSVRQIKPKIYLDPQPTELFKTKDLPF